MGAGGLWLIPAPVVITQCRFYPTYFRSCTGERGLVPRSVPPPDWVLTRRQAVGDRIRAARLYANLTQEAVALHAGLDRASYNRIEQGHSSPLLDTLFRIADAIGVPLADLVRQ